MRFSRLAILVLLVGAVVAERTAIAQATPKEATEATKQHNSQMLSQLPFNSKQDFENASKGFIATLPEVKVVGAKKETPFGIWGRTHFSSRTCLRLPTRACGELRSSI